MKSIKFYSVFHLNLAYSSIEEEQQAEVIEHCYVPLLRLARKHRLPLGIETTGYTLERIAALAPAWLDELRQLTADRICEVVGSGYAQVIGPLVPSAVNQANLRLGNETYERLLGFRPTIALVNEQAYSSGLVRHYLDAGYRAIVMEWDNPARCHPDWNPDWRYLPQLASGPDGEEIPVIWNQCISFQKFQRYAHGEMPLEEYQAYLGRHLSETPRAFPIYGNDAEIFDFRPGRYPTEPELTEMVEWTRIEQLFENLLGDPRFRFISPSEVLSLRKAVGASNRLRLQSAEQPIPVKKQGHYNVTRWAVTGRDNLGINTACWRIYEALARRENASPDDWRELCYLWGSDFRTHITRKRWLVFRDRLATFEKRLAPGRIAPSLRSPIAAAPLPKEVHVDQTLREITIETDQLLVQLSRPTGLSLRRLWFKGLSPTWQCGTLPHGYYDDVNWSMDHYSGHFIFEAPGQLKITDLQGVGHTMVFDPATARLLLRTTLQTPLGPLHKQVAIDCAAARVEFAYEAEWAKQPSGLLRLGYVTLNPEEFEWNSLFFRTHNGGVSAEKFPIKDQTISHGAPLSFSASAQSGFGVTAGSVDVGDDRHFLRIEVPKSQAAMLGMITSQRVDSSNYFCGLRFSVRECDETCLPEFEEPPEGQPRQRFSIAIRPSVT